VRNQLASLVSRGGESEAVDDVVESQFKKAKEVLTGHVGAALSSLKEAAELGLANAIDAAHLLLLAELEAVVTNLAAAHHVHAWGGRALLK
jgi:hypothetical protein